LPGKPRGIAENGIGDGVNLSFRQGDLQAFVIHRRFQQTLVGDLIMGAVGYLDLVADVQVLLLGEGQQAIADGKVEAPLTTARAVFPEELRLQLLLVAPELGVDP